MSTFNKKFTMPKTLKHLIVAAGLVISHSSFATAITDEYTVTSTATAAGSNTWTFTYAITNNNQGVGTYTGLDGFGILVPDSSSVISSVSPASYVSGGYWNFLENPPTYGNDAIPYESALGADAVPPAGYHWDIWWGYGTQSVYPIGSTATFGVTLSNVGVGTSLGPIITFQGNYSILTTNVIAPSAVPIPPAFGFGLSELAIVGLIAYRRKSNS